MDVLVTCSQCGSSFTEPVPLYKIATGRGHSCSCPKCNEELSVTVNVTTVLTVTPARGPA